jgi:hypothetical protein
MAALDAKHAIDENTVHERQLQQARAYEPNALHSVLTGKFVRARHRRVVYPHVLFQKAR